MRKIRKQAQRKVLVAAHEYWFRAAFLAAAKLK